MGPACRPRSPPRGSRGPAPRAGRPSARSRRRRRVAPHRRTRRGRRSSAPARAPVGPGRGRRAGAPPEGRPCPACARPSARRLGAAAARPRRPGARRPPRRRRRCRRRRRGWCAGPRAASSGHRRAAPGSCRSCPWLAWPGGRGEDGDDLEAAGRPRACLELPAEHGDALAHAEQAMATRRRAGHLGMAVAVIDDLDVEAVAGVADRDGGLRRTRVPHRVGERLLHDPVGGQVQPGRQRPGLALHHQRRRQAGLVGALDEGGQLRDGWLWRELVGCWAAPLEDADQPAHLAERLPAGGVDEAQPGIGLGGAGAEQGSGGVGLHRDHADVVRDDVVQLAGDAGAFGQDGVVRVGLLLPAQLPGDLREAAGTVATRSIRTGSPEWPARATAAPTATTWATPSPTRERRAGACSATVYRATRLPTGPTLAAPPKPSRLDAAKPASVTVSTAHGWVRRQASGPAIRTASASPSGPPERNPGAGWTALAATRALRPAASSASTSAGLRIAWSRRASTRSTSVKARHVP